MERRAIAEAEKFIWEQLVAGPKAISDLVKTGGFSMRTLERAAQRLKVRRTRAGKKWQMAVESGRICCRRVPLVWTALLKEFIVAETSRYRIAPLGDRWIITNVGYPALVWAGSH